MKALVEIDVGAIDVIGDMHTRLLSLEDQRLLNRVEMLERHVHYQELRIRALERNARYDPPEAEMIPHRLSATSQVRVREEIR